MARKRQTRRSVSVRGTTYQRIKKYVDAQGGSVANFIEELLVEKLGTPTDEDRRKFGEDVERREKETAARTAAEEQDELAEYVKPITFF